MEINNKTKYFENHISENSKSINKKKTKLRNKRNNNNRNNIVINKSLKFN